MTNFEALLVFPYLRAFLPIFRKQSLYFSLFGELQGWQVRDEILNFAFNQQKRAENIFKKIVAPNIISEETRRSLKPA